MKISAEAKKLYDFLPPLCWMTKEHLAKALRLRASKIKVLKDELEAARLLKILFHLNGKRANPRHEIIKLSGRGNPICQHISKSYCIGEWRRLDRNSLIECYLKSGWGVLPFAPRAKKPVRGFSAYRWGRMTAAQKMDYFFDNPSLNVGLVVCSHLMVVDVDAKNNVWIEHDDFHNTLTVSTPRGFHFYFRNDAVVTTSTKLLPDIDTRCRASFVVLPPSIGSNNKPYEWETIARPNHLPIEFRREWRQREFEARKRSATSFILPAFVGKGSRNETLWRYGRSLKCKGNNFYEIEAELTDYNRNNCSPPLPAAEMETLILNVWSRPNKPAFDGRNLA
jgi:hypothetical protein